MPPIAPVEELKRVLLEKVGPSRAHILITPLTQSTDGLARIIEARNEWILSWKARGIEAVRSRTFFDSYFGIRSEDGSHDSTYSDFMHGLCKHNDDCIGFALALIQALEKHAGKLVDHYGSDAPKIAKPNFGQAEEEKLIPDMSRYSKWAEQ